MISKSGIGFVLGDNQQAVDKICSVAVTTKIETRWVKVHNSVKHLKQLRQACPNTRLIGRLTAPEWLFESFIRQITSGVELKPEDAAVQYYVFMNKLIDADAPKTNMWWEVTPPGFACWNYSGWLNKYYIAIMKLLEADGRRGVICNFYTGTPHTRSDGIDGWTPFMPAIQWAATHGHIIGAQAYWEFPDRSMQDPNNWTAYRPLRVLKDYQFPSGTIWVPTEFGWDGPGGYKTAGTYIEDKDYYDAIVRADIKFRTAPYPVGVRVDGFTLFILQASGSEWDNFLFWEIFDQLLAYIVAVGADTGDDATHPLPVPLPEPVPQPAGTYVAPVALLNIRRGPGSKYARIGTMATNEKSLVGEDAVSSIGESASWIWVETPTVKGWGAAWFFRKVTNG